MKKFKIGFRLERDNIFYGLDSEGNREGVKMNSSEESCRKYQHVKISIDDGFLTQLPSLDRFNVSQVETLYLRFKWSERILLSKVMELLSRMPLLQFLTFDLSAACTIDTSNTLDAHFKKLKQLKVQVFGVINQSIKILRFIKADNVTKLTYRTFAKHFDAEIDVMADFIKSNTSLTMINITADLLIQLHRRNDFSGMNLESLNAIDGFNLDISDTVIDNFRKSLISNSHSLTSLLIHSRLMSKKILVVIFNCLRKLTSLDIDGGHGGDGSWMSALSSLEISRNASLKNLKIDPFGAIDGLRVILQHAPELKKLWLRHATVTDKIMKEVATSAPRLVELRFSHLKENLTGDQRFNELKFLIIEIIDIVDVDFIASLLERCPKIEVFDCRIYLSKDPSSLIDILQQQNTLKHLRFNCHWLTTRQIIFDRLKSNGNLRSLKLEMYGTTVEVTSSSCLTFPRTQQSGTLSNKKPDSQTFKQQTQRHDDGADVI